MKDIAELDPNFKVDKAIEREGMKFYDVLEEPFEINGVKFEDGKFRRMPEQVAKSVSPGVHGLSSNTAGGRVRFRTDSPYIAISYKGEMGKMPHFAFTGSCGFDLYFGTRYVNTFIPGLDDKYGFDRLADYGVRRMEEVTINFPLYSNVERLYIGLDENARVEKPSPYIDKKPIVYYGSSITQGGCASRPGTSYQSIISRRFNVDYVNLGFSGNARAEDEMIEYIKSLEMSVFVYDYDHNSPSCEHLASTHEKLFRALRQVQPNLPVIMMSRPKYYLTPDEKTRREIVKTTYENALASGDKNVYFLDGYDLCRLCLDEGTVDGCHPTDFGFASMAKAVGDVISEYRLLW